MGGCPKAWGPGGGVFVIGNGPLAVRQAVAAAIGEMSEAGQRRAEAVLAARRQPVPVDIEALAEELKAF